MDFAGRTVLVTGAASGIGRAVAERFAAGGACLALLDRDADALSEFAAALTQRHVEVLPLVVDLTDDSAVETVIAEAHARFGRLDVLVNNAGIGIEKPLLAHTIDDFRRLFEVNLFAAFVALRETARRMIADRTDGRIVNIASVAGLRGSAGRAAYGPSKAALINLTQIAAVELAPHGIRVNAVAPGPVETALVRRMHRPETRAAWLRCVPQRRYGEPAEVAGAVAWLASDDARFVTGHVLVVDGGFAAAGIIYEPDGSGSDPQAGQQREEREEKA